MFDEYTDIVTIDELQEMLRIGRSTAYKLLRSGQVKAIHSGRVWLIPKMSIILIYQIKLAKVKKM